MSELFGVQTAYALSYYSPGPESVTLSAPLAIITLAALTFIFYFYGRRFSKKAHGLCLVGVVTSIVVLFYYVILAPNLFDFVASPLLFATTVGAVIGFGIDRLAGIRAIRDVLGRGALFFAYAMTMTSSLYFAGSWLNSKQLIISWGLHDDMSWLGYAFFAAFLTAATLLHLVIRRVFSLARTWTTR